MSDRRYPVPWDLVLGLGRKIQRAERTSIDQFTAAVAGRLHPAPEFQGLENLPDSPRFILAANHYQRKGLWILHTAAALTRPIHDRYAVDPPVRWMVTANWPRIKLGPLNFPSPGDWLLPKVAHTLWCYPVSFAGTNPAYTARSLRAILRDISTMKCPLGIFPEGVAGTADKLYPPLPGAGRLFTLLAKAGLPVLPARVSESAGLAVRFGKLITIDEIVSSPKAAELVMSRIGLLSD
jgi:hypothetical protein